MGFFQPPFSTQPGPRGPSAGEADAGREVMAEEKLRLMAREENPREPSKG